MTEQTSPHDDPLPPRGLPILVGVDGSEDGRRALTFAWRAARQRDCDLVIVHAVDDAVLAGAWGVVYDPSLLQQAGESVVEDAHRRAVEAGFPAERMRTEVVMGNPGGVLVRMSEQASLLVVGRRSVRGLERLFVGSTSVGVASSSHCPVVMVSGATNVAETGGLHRIGVGVEPHPSSELALEWGFREARLRKAELRVLHAWAQPSGLFAPQLSDDKLAELGAAAERTVHEMVDRLSARYPDVLCHIEVVQGPPVDELVKRSEELDLLLLGVHANAFGGVGAVVRGVMAHSRCPLALVRSHPPR